MSKPTVFHCSFQHKWKFCMCQSFITTIILNTNFHTFHVMHLSYSPRSDEQQDSRGNIH
ncbi:hypothetical protein [Escherichia phage dw-ec]|nr:hypothetical protein [Escherichia phage BI-EHEC]UJQ43691.1 hypothetical protein [Escherichia phage dw-ec]